VVCIHGVRVRILSTLSAIFVPAVSSYCRRRGYRMNALLDPRVDRWPAGGGLGLITSEYARPPGAELPVLAPRFLERRADGIAAVGPVPTAESGCTRRFDHFTTRPGVHQPAMMDVFMFK
jgi:hypothetical protein